MIFADTGYFIALFTPRDQLHDRAVAWSGTIHEPVVTTEYVLLECVNALSKACNRASARTLVNHVHAATGWECIPASREIFDAGLRLHFAHTDKDWSLTDCISFQVMRSKGITQALAYDGHFNQAGFEPLLRKLP
jgi:predicted nucleic acid-binding protein